MKSFFDGIPPSILKKRKKISQPTWIPPMLATLTNDYFSNDAWIYEHKFDGERCIAFKNKGKVHLVSRNDKSMNEEYPEIVEAIAKQDADNFIIDGEIVAIGKSGVADFQLLQGRMHREQDVALEKKYGTIRIAYCIFDLIYVDGYDVRSLPLLARKKLLKRLLNYRKPLVYTNTLVGNGLTLFKKACKMHWEGLIVKHKESTYVGKRSRDWLKFKCIMKQELVIGGYTSPRGSRNYFGALLVGYYDHGKLKYAGKVGTGYTQDTLAMLGKKLSRLTRKQCPFDDYDEMTAEVHWVKPELVAEFEFAQWTNAGKLRVGRYKGLRDDKDAQDVVKEVPKAIGPT